jgi:quinolinate synthase
MMEEISRLKEDLGAVILAHNYQPGPVQVLADLVGDSLELSRTAARLDCQVIIFCGVDFMAETAAILSPDKRVILPAAEAWCPMASMIAAEDLRDIKSAYPEAAVVCYVNSTAETKAESDICCTSANGVEVVASLEEDEVIFVPDRNLADYVSRWTEKRIIKWDGYCYVHDRFTPEEVKAARLAHPGAEVLVHPECRPEVIDLADHACSTSGMGRRAKASGADEFVIGTEVGMIYRLEKENPGKRFYPLSPEAICTNMKKTTPEKVLRALRTLEPRVVVAEETARLARRSIERMLSL